MKRIALLAVLFVAAAQTFPQCPFTASLAGSGECPGATLTVTAPKNIAKIVWMKDGTTVGSAQAVASYNPVGVTVAGGNGPGIGSNQLDHPQGIFVDLDGDVLVADENNNRVQAWAAGATAGTTLASSYGVGSDQLVFPLNVFADGYGNYYITDNTKNRIEKWIGYGNTYSIVAGGNGSGSGANQLGNPFGIFVDGNSNLYIADIPNQRIQKWALGATS
ncbi:MAG TPA: hypothetical protein VNU70_13905, partial [Puia sp.]|nr:hypothetical protein [Puia sp.]